MLLRLGLETAAYQGPADEDRLRALGVTTVEAYRALLVRILGFESSVERIVLRMKELDQTFIEDRLRSMYLREDLRAIGVSDVDIGAVTSSAAVSIDSPAHALGWLFVLERQMLVSGLIRRHMQHVLGPAVSNAIRYWSAYGDRPGTRFRAFAEGLSQHARRLAPKLIVHGAIDAFRNQRQWYRTAPIPPRVVEDTPPTRAAG